MIKSEQELRTIYGHSKGRAAIKTFSQLDNHSRKFIRHSSFLLLSSHDASGNIDSSPRGGAPGFIHINDNDEIIIPDYKGNNRLDSLMNILQTGKVGCLFLVGGVGIMLRVNGPCFITDESSYLDHFASNEERPRTVLVINVEELFFHCSKAIFRANLWLPPAEGGDHLFPSIGAIITEQLDEFEKSIS